MNKFKHRIELISKLHQNVDGVMKSIQKFDILDELGEDGWRLVSTFMLGHLIYGCFEKELDKNTIIVTSSKEVD